MEELDLKTANYKQLHEYLWGEIKSIYQTADYEEWPRLMEAKTKVIGDMAHKGLTYTPIGLCFLCQKYHNKQGCGKCPLKAASMNKYSPCLKYKKLDYKIDDLIEDYKALTPRVREERRDEIIALIDYIKEVENVSQTSSKRN